LQHQQYLQQQQQQAAAAAAAAAAHQSPPAARRYSTTKEGQLTRIAPGITTSAGTGRHAALLAPLSVDVATAGTITSGTTVVASPTHAGGDAAAASTAAGTTTAVVVEDRYGPLSVNPMHTRTNINYSDVLVLDPSELFTSRAAREADEQVERLEAIIEQYKLHQAVAMQRVCIDILQEQANSNSASNGGNNNNNHKKRKGSVAGVDGVTAAAAAAAASGSIRGDGSDATSIALAKASNFQHAALTRLTSTTWSSLHHTNSNGSEVMSIHIKDAVDDCFSFPQPMTAPLMAAAALAEAIQKAAAVTAAAAAAAAGGGRSASSKHVEIKVKEISETP
jgi:hypothetical protein